MDDRVKILRMLIVLRMIRIFKYSTFSKGVKVSHKKTTLDPHQRSLRIDPSAHHPTLLHHDLRHPDVQFHLLRREGVR
jgi:hypothetical protein